LLDGASSSNKFLCLSARRGPTTARLALAPPCLASRLAPTGSLPSGDDRLHHLREMRETFAQGTRGPASDLVTTSRIDQLDLAAVHQTLVAWHGSRDRYAPLPAMRALVDRLPNASLRLVEDSDHFIFESHPDGVMADLSPSG
jgi:pimeloyl-ACP methyl ester carboxylesterase